MSHDPPIRPALQSRRAITAPVAFSAAAAKRQSGIRRQSCEDVRRARHGGRSRRPSPSPPRPPHAARSRHPSRGPSRDLPAALPACAHAPACAPVRGDARRNARHMTPTCPSRYPQLTRHVTPVYPSRYPQLTRHVTPSHVTRHVALRALCRSHGGGPCELVQLLARGREARWVAWDGWDRLGLR